MHFYRLSGRVGEGVSFRGREMLPAEVPKSMVVYVCGEDVGSGGWQRVKAEVVAWGATASCCVAAGERLCSVEFVHGCVTAHCN